MEFDYDCPIIHVGIKSILPSKDISKLKDLPKTIMRIGITCQSYNIGEVHVSSNISSLRTSICTGQINKGIKELCHRNNFVFVDHKKLISNDLWVDSIYLANSGKSLLAGDFVKNINEL